MSRWFRRTVLALALLLAFLFITALAGGLWLRGRLRASLPQVQGEALLEGLSGPVRIERDSLGVPRIRAGNRLDLARATGFVHAQERFFQMDLLRRRAAGELAELFGRAALPLDRATRVHQFRKLAGRVVRATGPDARAILDAYAAGVNAGLASLGEKPPEYLLLRGDPTPWTLEDCVLTIMNMFLELHDEDGSRESALGLMHDLLPEPVFEYLAPRGTEWDAPVRGGPFSQPPVPGSQILDLRAAAAREAPARVQDPPSSPLPPGSGSNNWALAGEHTAHGGALLANDMHLPLAVPNIWYRASFAWPDLLEGGEHRVTGVTLPGTPAVVAGSNTRVAWGFTNSYGDWVDLIVVEIDPEDRDSYITRDGSRPFERQSETIRVKGEDDESLEIVSTIWGPIIDEDHRGRPRALRWTAYEPSAVNLELLGWETARDIDEAIAVANRGGAPPQNFVVADSTGRIGWTIFGAIPRRVGFDGRLPTSWADGTRRWDGWLEPEEYPRIVDPEGGRLWTANARVVDGEMLALLGDGGYDLGARAGQIRDALMGLQGATAEEMLAIQLDDRALFLRRWRELLLETLTPAALEADPRRREFRRLVEDWGGRASVDSAGFRLVRAFREFVYEALFETLTAPCKEADERFSFHEIPQEKGPLWSLITERPMNFLDPRYTAWEEQLLAVVDKTIDYFHRDGTSLADRTWGERNTIHVSHPMSRALPFLSGWLDMQPSRIPGDNSMPRVQSGSFGASQRMVVSPGRETEGIFHMPGGQSGHPLSPHYRDGHEAWVRGEPTPFLPGPPVSTLVLLPSR